MKASSRIEEKFFQIDPETNTAYVKLSYHSPDDIIDSSFAAAIPILRESFFEQISRIFSIVPEEYSVELLVSFEDFGKYTIASLREIWDLNFQLEFESLKKTGKAENKLALWLCFVGILFVIGYFLLITCWIGGGEVKEVIAFLLEIMATVPFWCAMEIYFVNNSEEKEKKDSLEKRFRSVSFSKN